MYLTRIAAICTLLLHAFVGSALVVSCFGCTSGVGSVGAIFGRDNETHALYVREVPKGLAADKAGLLPGDQVIMIDGFYVRDLKTKEIKARLRGTIDTTVDLTLLRGSEVHHVHLKRAPLREHELVQPTEEMIAP